MKDRLQSLDALRGFDMLMIMGMGPVIVRFCEMCGWGADCALAQQFAHVEWNGLHFEDTIFPLFLFLAGVSWPFSHAKQRERGVSTQVIVLKCLRRAVILFVLGLVYNGLLSGTLRMGAVLSRIGVAWAVGAFLYMFCRLRTLAVLAVGIPIIYWLLLWFVPAPDALTVQVADSLAYVRDFGTGPFSIVGNLSGWFDRHLMPGVLIPYTGIADNQSALGYIPATGTALLGVLSGEFLRRTRTALRPTKRILCLFSAAVALVALGLVVAKCFGEMSMPINKKLWSSSFTFVVGGYSVAMLALFHWIVDVLGLVRWTFFFRVIGMNSITIYLTQRFVPFELIAKELFGGLAGCLPGSAAGLVLAIAYVALCWLYLLFLYRKNVFLKV